MKKRELLRYAATHSACTGNLSAGFDHQKNTGVRNMAFHRRFCLAILTPDLDRVSTLNEKAATIERFYHKYQDHGATYLFHRTKPEPDMPIYRDRATLVYYLCRLFAKLSYLAGLVYEICITNARKVIVFCDWPSTAWVVELVMLLLNFNVLSIRAKHLLSEREAVVTAFNDDQNPVQVRVVRYLFTGELPENKEGSHIDGIWIIGRVHSKR